jgi:FkbM family methyltransferase
MARSVDTVHRLLNNDTSNMRINGEAWLLAQLSDAAHTVFDVGSYRGDWTCQALEHLRPVSVHAFEPMPKAFEELVRRYGQDARVHLNQVALSNTRRGELRMWSDSNNGSLSSAVAPTSSSDRELLVPCTTGDDYASSHSIGHIDVLKIDVEGHEMEVLEGFRQSFTDGAVDVVQFEFTLWAAIARRWLADYYDFFAQWGFTVGKLWPRTVRLQAYSPAAEEYFRCNFVAVRPGTRAASILGSVPIE